MNAKWTKCFDLYRTRNVQFHCLVESAGWKTKVYTLAKQKPFEAAEALAASLKNLGTWLQRSANCEYDVYNIACLIVHECDDGVFSVLNWWTGEHMLQNFVYFSAEDNPQQFELISEGGLTCCVWEMAVFWHERNAWIQHVLEKGDRPQIDSYLSDVLEGAV